MRMAVFAALLFVAVPASVRGQGMETDQVPISFTLNANPHTFHSNTAAGGGVLLSEGAIGRLCRRGCAPEITLALVLVIGGVLWAVHGYRCVRRWWCAR